MGIQEFIRSKTFTKIIIGLGIFIVTLCVFRAGVFFGYHRAAFSYQWGDNYYRMFDGRRPGGMGMMADDFLGSHGVAGKIISVQLPVVVIEGRNKVERSVVVTDETAIRQFRGAVASSSLKIGDMVVVVGMPNAKSQIEATLIRILPPLPEPPATSTPPLL